ncbi:spinster family MFS transporter [Paraburkholderia susongensis]|uniref:Fucose permease n=1 Tax=Paraburkholderia susongensis TaxID=1515439 RepID=A0A1X7KT46_9BURK|nr:MFS transporter [Paraburkholderia susongensis]SMG44389.1 Fucose permease [Paraburkholderia susongensis]
MIDHNAYPTSRRAWLTVVILLFAYVLSFVDRQILNLLVAPVRRDMVLTDTQMSLLMGLSFAVFYALAGIPLGRIVDTRSRRGLIFYGVLFWSLMTAGCGVVKVYWQFLLMRVGTGAGEATLSPAAYSILADSFPPEKRATAISVYGMGVYIGVGMAYLLGGGIITWANARGDVVLPLFGLIKPWQLIFLVLGALGISFCLLLLAIKEPARKGAGAGVAVPLKDVGRYIVSIRKAVLSHNLGFACLVFASYGVGAWTPTFFVRDHGMTPGEVGLYVGSISMVAGSLGVVSGGRLADYLARRGYRDSNMRVALFGAVLTGLCSVVYLIDDMTVVWVLMFVYVFVAAMPNGVAAAAIQEIMPNSMRGQTSAIYLFVVTLIGLGLGPTAVALLTDYVFRDDMAVRYSIVWVASLATGSGALLIWSGLKPYAQARKTLEDWEPDRETDQATNRQIQTAGYLHRSKVQPPEQHPTR